MTSPVPGAARRRWWSRPAGQVAVLGTVLVAATAALIWYGSRHNYLDLRIYDGAVRWWASGRPLYDYARPDKVQGSLGFTYPPFAALLMYPMAALPFPAVLAVMWLADAVAVLVTTAWLLVPVADRHGWPRWYAVGLAVPLVSVLEPVRETVTFGQINLLLELLVLWDLLFLVPRRSRFAGLGIGLAAAIKLTPALFVGYLLVTRRFRAAAGAVVTAVLATGLAAALAPRDSWRYWTSVLWQSERVGHLDGVPNQSLLGALARLAHPAPPSRPLWAVLVLVVLVVGLWRAARAARLGDAVAGIALTGLTASLVSPVSWQHHLVWFVPALVVLLDVGTSPGAGRVRAGALGILTWVTVSYSVIAWFDWGLVPRGRLHTPFGLLVADWHVLLMLVLLVMLPARRVADPPPALLRHRVVPAPPPPRESVGAAAS